jgi:LuxR family maltose regulon positive regulatory protein
VPNSPRWIVSRADLIDDLRSASECRLVVITAAAGSGKTMLLDEWAARDDRMVVSASLGPGDDDPVALAGTIANAFFASVAGSTIAPTVPRLTAKLENASAALTSAIRGANDPFVLLLDDTERLTDHATLDLVDQLVDSIPAGSQLVLAGRAHLGFVGSRRLDVDLREVAADDLVIDATGAVKVFDAAGVHLDEDLAAEVVQRTDGWPAGVYLAALIARELPDAWTSPLPISGTDRFFADYLLREALDSASDARRDFLIRSAVLDRMCAPLCEHALGISGAQDLLLEIEQQNLFLVPLDRTRTWFRFHPLFRDFLLSELRRRQPDTIDGLLRRAAEWHRADGSDEQALEYLFRVGDVEELGPLLAGLLPPTYHSGRLSTANRWLDRCSDEIFAAHPSVAILAAWGALLSGQPQRAQRWAATIDRIASATSSDDGAAWLGSAATLRCVMCADGVDEMLRNAELAVELEPVWSRSRPPAVWMLGLAHELLGDREAAKRRYDEVIALDRDNAPMAIIGAVVARALMAMDDADWVTARTAMNSAMSKSGLINGDRSVTVVLADAAAARLELHDGNRARCEHSMSRAMSERQLATSAAPHISVSALCTLADVHLALGDVRVATTLIGEVDEILAVRPDLGRLVDKVEQTRRKVDAARISSATPLSTAEMRLLPYLATHLSFTEIGAELYVSRSTVKSHAAAIYRKLATASRSAAVDRARELGLITP